MSRENVEIVQAFYAAFDQGDEAAMRAILDVEVEWDTTARIDGRVTHGIEDTRASVEEGFSSFDGVRIEPQEMRDAGDEVAVRLRGWFRGASSGVETETSWAAVFTIRDGTIRRYRDYVGWPKALKAAGLSE
jgi:ketosteroid isomerase-like protein